MVYSFTHINHFSKLLLIQFLAILFYGCNEKKSNYESNPLKAKIIISDIELFWKAYDKVVKDSLSDAFQKDYIEKGSQGVIDFIPNKRIVSANTLKKLVLAEKDYYDNVRGSTLKSLEYEKQIRSTYLALKYLYPKVKFPPLYFVIGRTTSGATATQNGLIVGVEVFSDKPLKTNYGRPALDLDLLPFIVAHEIIHFLQPNDSTDNSLLKKCIREGSADFIAELTSGEKVKILNGDNVHPYGNTNEEKLWIEFKKIMHKENNSPWLYSQTLDGRPQNLGYWIGYKIVEAYYNKSSDKIKAINDILNIKEYKEFLKLSGYDQKFK